MTYQDLFSAKMLPLYIVAKKAFDARRGFESGLLEMRIEGRGSFNVLVSKNSRNSDGSFYL